MEPATGLRKSPIPAILAVVGGGDALQPKAHAQLAHLMGKRARIAEIAFEDLDGDRAAFRRAQQAEDDLRPVAPMIAAVAELRQFAPPPLQSPSWSVPSNGSAIRPRSAVSTFGTWSSSTPNTAMLRPKKAVELVRAGRAEALMKGSLHTDELMGAVVSKTGGIRTERRISHCFIMDVPGHPDPLIVTDAAVNIAPRSRRESRNSLLSRLASCAVAVMVAAARRKAAGPRTH